MVPWSVLALELAQRSAEFGSCKSNEAKRDNDFLKLSDLDQYDNGSTSSKSWWWPNIPLIRQLIENGQNSLAVFISLSNYGHDGSLSWVHFVCDDYPKDRSDRIRTAVEHYKNNQENILTMTGLLENLEAVSEKKIILINFYDTDTDKIEDVECQQLLVANWPESCIRTNNSDEGDIATFINNCVKNFQGDFNPAEGFIDKTKWYESLDEKSKKTTKLALKRYIAWLNYAHQGVDSWKTMLTVPVPFNPKDLPGIHSGAIHIYIRRDQWITDRSKIIEEISSFATAFWAGSTVIFKDDLEEFKRARKKAEQQSRMLQLLLRPLNSLTEAIAQTHQDTQRLRSILFEPHKALFSVHPTVEEYFNEDADGKYGMVRWKTSHTIKDMEPYDAACMLSAIICHIFGRQPKGTEDTLTLYAAVEELLTSDDPAFEKLRNSLKSLNQEEDLRILVDHLKLRLRLSSEPVTSETLDKDKLITNLLVRLKTIIFTPFKFEDKTPLLPLVLIISDYFTNEININFRGKSYSMQDMVKNFHTRNLFEKVEMLVPQYSKILSFISGVLAYIHSKNEIIDSVSISSNDIKRELAGFIEISFTGKPFNLGKIDETFELMTTAAKNQLRTIQGNFRKPFVDFASTVMDSVEINTYSHVTPKCWVVEKIEGKDKKVLAWMEIALDESLLRLRWGKGKWKESI